MKNWGVAFAEWLLRDQQRRNEEALVKRYAPETGEACNATEPAGSEAKGTIKSSEESGERG